MNDCKCVDKREKTKYEIVEVENGFIVSSNDQTKNSHGYYSQTIHVAKDVKDLAALVTKLCGGN